MANTIFYLAQTTSENSWKEHSSQDVDAPNKPTIQNVIADGLNEKVKVNFTGVTDKGTSYDYYVEATGDKNHVKTNSDVESATVLSGLEGYSYVIDNNPNTTPDNVIDTTDTNFTVNKAINSNFYVHVVAIDKIGNVSDVSTLHVVANPTAWTKGSVKLSATASDNETSVKRIKFPNGNYISGGFREYTVHENGVYTFLAEDYVGNKTTKSITVANIDKTPPTAPVLVNQDWVKADKVTVSVQSGNDALSGVQYVEYRLSGATSSGWIRYNGMSTVSNEGETTITARTVDEVGNVSAESQAYVRIDRSSPYNMGITIKLKS